MSAYFHITDDLLTTQNLLAMALKSDVDLSAKIAAGFQKKMFRGKLQMKIFIYTLLFLNISIVALKFTHKPFVNHLLFFFTGTILGI